MLRRRSHRDLVTCLRCRELSREDRFREGQRIFGTGRSGPLQRTETGRALMATRDEAIDAWVRRAVDAVRAGGSLSAHPHMILDAPVPVREALAFGKAAFVQLLPSLKGGVGV